jgi:phage terminase small subunit
VPKKISKTTADTPLTIKQELFVSEYIIDFNATQAAIRAGYSHKAARFTGCENITKPNIQAAIQRVMQDRVKRTKIDQDFVLQQLVKIQQVSISDFLVIENGKAHFDLSKATKAQLAALSEVQVDTIGRGNGALGDRVKIKLPDKLKTLELLGKHVDVQAFNEKREHNVTTNAQQTIKDILFEIDGTSRGLPQK